MKPEPKIFPYIRWSSPAQSHGSSEARQRDSTDRIAERLSKERSLPISYEYAADRGLSGYHEDHIKHGALGKLVQAVKDKQIAPGSVLVIDSMSRFSRGRLGRVMSRFEDLIESGVSVYIADKTKEYNTDNVDTLESDLSISIESALYRQESRQKERYANDRWQRARKNFAATGAPLSANAPHWLEPVRDERGRTVEFKPIPEAERAIKRMFELALAGYGSPSIAKMLDAEGAWVPKGPRRKYAGWSRHTVSSYLRNPAVTGFYQPRKVHRENGQRVYKPEGPAREDYFSRIIDPGTFARVKRLLDAREARRAAGAARIGGGGRTGKVPGLLKELATCARCGEPMTPEPKAPNRRYLVCAARCTQRRAPYGEIEQQLLARCDSSLDVADLLPDDVQRSELSRLRQQREAREAERAEAETRRQRFIRRIGAEEDDAEAHAMREEAAAERERAEAAEAARDDLDQQIEVLAGAPEQIARGLRDVREIAQRLRTTEGDDLIDLRVRLREALRVIIESVKIDAEAGWAEVQLGSRAAQRQHARGQRFARTRWTIRWTPLHTRRRRRAGAQALGEKGEPSKV